MRIEFPSHAKHSGLPLGLKLGLSCQESSPQIQYIKTVQWVGRDPVCLVASRQVDKERFQCDIGKNSARGGLKC